MKGPLTGPRLKALSVLVTCGPARIGVGMWISTEDNPIVTPAAEAWLLDMGYATPTTVAGRRGVEITDAGRAVHREAMTP